MYIINFIRGFCMSLADSVPGVSGGTVAFLLGFYDEFINSLNDLMSGSFKERKKALVFLFKIGIGWVTGFLLAAAFLANIFDSQIYKISSLFLGFIIFAIPIVIKEEKEVLTSDYKNAVFCILGIAVVVAVTYFNPVSGEGIKVEVSHLNIKTIIYIFFASMIAISAMVLPGISGSTLLLIFGLYVPIISAVKEVMTFNFSYLPVLIICGLGFITGIAVVIKFIKISLEKFRPQTIYTIIGLMIGSFYAIVMGPSTLEIPQEPMSVKTFSIIFFIIGGIIIYGLQYARIFLENKK